MMIDSAGVLLNRVACVLVDHPEEVRVDVLQGRYGVMYEVDANPVDVPRLIGSGGRTADALRELMKNFGGKVGRRFMFSLVEPARG